MISLHQPQCEVRNWCPQWLRCVELCYDYISPDFPLPRGCPSVSWAFQCPCTSCVGPALPLGTHLKCTKSQPCPAALALLRADSQVEEMIKAQRCQLSCLVPDRDALKILQHQHLAVSNARKESRRKNRCRDTG